MKYSELRCTHRHTIKTHPACFANGNIKWPDDRTFERYSGNPWFTFPEYKIGYFDIEVDNLKADFGTVLTWAIKDKGGEVFVDSITRDELLSDDCDRRVVESFVNKMNEYKIIVGYYSTMFDLPFMRSKALHYRIPFPEFGDIFHWDIYYTVRSKFNLSRKSLESACDYFGIKGKTPIEREVWRRAKYGHPDAISTVIDHNIADVVITEELHDLISFSRKWNRRSI